MNLRFRCVAVLFGTLFFTFGPALQAAKVSSLPPQYKHWIEVEVPYIISSAEKKQFLALSSNAERDNFIQGFWDEHNPEPGSNENTFKEEHYRRLTYANQHFGNQHAQDGWRTDQGMIYIILGAPQQKVTYPEARNVRSMELWFYQSPTEALPTHFYILFYKRSVGEPFTLYSPYQDGPNRLVTGLENLNDQKRALSILEKSLGSEMAHISLSLIPTEPTDLDDYNPSMQSDVLLSNIKGLADNPLTLQRLEMAKSRERVTTSVFTGREDSNLMYDVARDEQGRLTLYYLLLNRSPDEKLVGPLADGSQGYSVTARANVATTSGQTIYKQEDVLSGPVSKDQVEPLSRKLFGVEGRLPLAAGTYEVAVTLTNNLNHEATVTRKTITLADPKPGTLHLSEVLAYTAPSPVEDLQGRAPFSFSRVRFTPLGAQNAQIHTGDKLPIVYQLWMPATAPGAVAAHTIHIHYVFGNVAFSGNEPPNVDDEDVEASNVDAAGNLLTGHTLDTRVLGLGHYRLIVKATDDVTKQTAFSTLNFEVTSADVPLAAWTVYGPSPVHGLAEDDMRRGLCAAALDHRSDAESWYRRALTDDVTYQPALTLLAESLSGAGDTAALAALSQQASVKQAAEPQTVVLIADALRKSSQGKEAIRFMTAQIALQPPSVLLDTTLADAYDEQGDHARAQQLRDQAKALK